MKNKKILAIDFGESNIGLAATDSGANLVFGKGSLKRGKSLDDIFKKIKGFCDEEQVVKVIFGLPKGKNAEDTEQTERYRRIGRKLSDYLGNIFFEFEDESFTSYEAREMSAGFEDDLLKTQYSEHELAAMIILRRYLHHHPPESDE